MDIAPQVRPMIVRMFKVDQDKVTDEARFIDDLHATSLDIVELIMSVEDEFQIEISDRDAEGIKTVGDVMAVIGRKARLPAGAA